MSNYDLASMPIYLIGKHLDSLRFETWNVANLLAKHLLDTSNDNFFVGDVINLPDNDLIVFMLPNFTDKILAFMMLLDISPDQLQDWLDGMLAEIPDEDYNIGNSEDTPDIEIGHDETTTNEDSTEELQTPYFEESAESPDSTNPDTLDNSGD